MEILRVLKRHVAGARGWRTSRKLIVFESDDWGTIRMASSAAFNQLANKGYEVDRCAYNRNDCLESNADLEMLFEVLVSFKDRIGNHPKITANTVVANPDFEKIREAQFSAYFYELFTSTLERYPEHDRVFDLYKKGMELGVFQPQFHCREHVNIFNWLRALQDGDEISHNAFQHHMFSVHAKGKSSCRNEFLDTFGSSDPGAGERNDAIIKDGLEIFARLFGFNSTTFIAPCYRWPSSIEKGLAENGVVAMQGINSQIESVANDQNIVKRHFGGQMNHFGQVYLTRNAFFEPAEMNESDPVGKCLRDIRIAFQWRRPATICTHRMNFIGSISPENRTRNLKLFKELLGRILDAFPSVEFVSTDELVEIMKTEQHV